MGSLTFGSRRKGLSVNANPASVAPYILYDAFTTNRAAGAVNGTLSESPVASGSGVSRFVTDANLKLSIASSLLTFVTGGAGNGNPGLWYGGIPRAAGVSYFARFIAPSNAMQISGGFDSAQSAALTECISFMAGGLIGVVNGSTPVTVGAYSANTYEICVIVRAVGSFYLIKGGAFTNWTLLWVNSNATGSVFPGVSARGTTFAGTVDNLRTPNVVASGAALLALLKALAYDTFTRADGSLGSTETVDPDLQIIPARVWTDQIGTMGVASNKWQASALSGGIALSTYDCTKADVLHAAKLTRSAGNVGVVVRYADANNYVIGYHDGTNAKLDKVVGGVTTNVISAAATYAANTEMFIICEGTSFRLFYNNAAVGSAATISDAALQSPTLVGLYTTNTSNTIDEVVTRARGSANEYSGLDTY